MSGGPRLPRPSSRVDERDTMFARAERRPGTPAYEDYYRRHPELRARDDRLRRMPRLMHPGGRHYHRIISPQARRHVLDIDEIEPEPSLIDDWCARLSQSVDPQQQLRRLVRELGAVEVGCTELPQQYLYSHKGRLDHDYGTPVRLDHPFVLLFLVEMDFAAMQRAPEAEIARETTLQYWHAARIAKNAEAVLRAAGHQAKAHWDAHYDIILPPLAVEAGLGEVGRNNILIADRFGSRVRIGAVTTDLPLELDRPVDLGARHFCRICNKCAANCPAHALSLGDEEKIRGTPRWPTHIERCYGYWRWLGTDCGICMSVCPFSHRDNWFHNTARGLVRHWQGSHPLALRLDDWLYGRAWRRGRWLPGGTPGR